MNSNKKYCLFPKPSFSHLYFLFYFVSSMVKQYIFKDIKEKENLSIPIFKLYVYEIGDFFSIIPYLIMKKEIKSEKITKSIANNYRRNFRYIYNDIFAKMKSRIIRNIFIISLINFIGQISTIIFYLIEGNQQMKVNHAYLNIVLIFNIIFLFLLTKFIMDISFYLYNYLSLIIFIICLIGLVFLDFSHIINNSIDFTNSLLYIVIKIFVALLYSIENIFAKIMFLKYYISPYFLLLIKATIKLCFLIIFSIPLFFAKFKDKNGEEKIIFLMIKDIFEDWKIIMFYIIYLINSFFYNILNYFIIDNFSSTHTAIAYIFEYFGIFIIYTITKSIKIDYIFGIRFIMFILLIIASLIYNEFIVINICGLANGTKLFLDYKEKVDLSLINEIKNFNINGNDYEDKNEESDRASLFRETMSNVELEEF